MTCVLLLFKKKITCNFKCFRYIFIKEVTPVIVFCHQQNIDTVRCESKYKLANDYIILLVMDWKQTQWKSSKVDDKQSLESITSSMITLFFFLIAAG